MDQKQITKQIMDFNKTALNSIFTAMNVAWDQNEKIFSSFMDTALWIPKEGKKAINDWISAFKKNSDNFKNLIEENFKKAEDLFVGSGSKQC